MHTFLVLHFSKIDVNIIFYVILKDFMPFCYYDIILLRK